MEWVHADSGNSMVRTAPGMEFDEKFRDPSYHRNRPRWTTMRARVSLITRFDSIRFDSVQFDSIRFDFRPRETRTRRKFTSIFPGVWNRHNISIHHLGTPCVGTPSSVTLYPSGYNSILGSHLGTRKKWNPPGGRVRSGFTEMLSSPSERDRNRGRDL